MCSGVTFVPITKIIQTEVDLDVICSTYLHGQTFGCVICIQNPRCKYVIYVAVVQKLRPQDVSSVPIMLIWMLQDFIPVSITHMSR